MCTSCRPPWTRARRTCSSRLSSKRRAGCATKGAAIQLARALALDWAPEGIRVNAVCPGIVDTPMLKEFFDAMPDPAAFRRENELAQPLGRLATPAEIASVVLFLASDAASLMTGSIVLADGGYTCW